MPKPPGTHFMVEPVRVRSVWLKVGYVVVWFLVARILLAQLISPDIPLVVYAIVGSALDLGAIVLGARIFRSRHEDPLPPRPWWQLTGRPRAGFVIGGLISVGSLATYVSDLVNPDRVDVVLAIASLGINLAIAFAYVRSSVLLRRRTRA